MDFYLSGTGITYIILLPVDDFDVLEGVLQRLQLLALRLEEPLVHCPRLSAVEAAIRIGLVAEINLVCLPDHGLTQPKLPAMKLEQLQASLVAVVG